MADYVVTRVQRRGPPLGRRALDERFFARFPVSRARVSGIALDSELSQVLTVRNGLVFDPNEIPVPAGWREQKRTPVPTT